MIKFILIFLLFTATNLVYAFEWRSPTTRFIEKETWTKIEQGLHEVQLSSNHRKFFNTIAQGEHVGFFGYHATTQEFRMYQDIIRLALEEIMKIPIRADFHFFRIPGESRYHHHSIKEYGNYLNDYIPADFVCLNYSIYSNYTSDFYSTYFYFATNSSSSVINFEEKLLWLFDRLGIDQCHIHELFTLGRKFLAASKTGVLFQFFDCSHNIPGHSHYEFVDPLLGTFAHNDMLYSQAIEGSQPSHFYLQSRLLMSNYYTLNPYSPFVIKRFELTDPEVIKQYEHAMKEYIKTFKIDPEKVQSYTDELEQLWNCKMPKVHIKARIGQPEGYPPRTKVPSDKVSWNTPFDEYNPPTFTDKTVLTHPSWADPEDFSEVTHALKSYEGTIKFDAKTKLPLNPCGRTGIQGRGLLGKWGPNLAADPIITRINSLTGSLEMLAIQRKDSSEWAIPGGMVEAGDDICQTLTRELNEETGILIDMSDAQEVYKGYVDDPRNTDNAWLESVAKHKHLGIDEALELTPKAASDAKAVQWLPLTKENMKKLYANHEEMAQKAIKNLKLP